jgi:2-dehydro-3-deoxyphosphogluconate aldolase/(4S)-4-hydroxy-2-oxoglutarate aldolase
MPGAFTPTEILTAWEAGADIVKVFPSEIGGPGYLKALRGPLPHVRLMPTGGVTLQTAADFLKAGACALGIGSSLVSAEAVKNRDLAGIERLARQFVAIIRQTRSRE